MLATFGLPGRRRVSNDESIPKDDITPSGVVPEAWTPATLEKEVAELKRKSVGVDAFGRTGERHGSKLFVDAETMKQQVRRALLKKTYNVFDLYKPTGLFPRIAKSQIFENLTLLVIVVNAIWMWIDTDWNKAENLLQADYEYQLMEHFFCIFFSFELYVRFASFARKRDAFRDGWFCFDSCLVAMMVMETWVMTTILVAAGGGQSLFNASILRLFRLLRLSRLARMLRSMPELMILIKGIMAATRSVVFTLVLLVFLLYMFAIALTQLTQGNPVFASDTGVNIFGNIPRSMYNLLLTGVFLDNLGPVMEDIGNAHPIFAVIFMLFIALAALMVMNMLIGVLCEVVSAVAAAEREDMLVTLVREKMEEVIKEVDKDGSGMVSQQEFKKIVVNERAVRALNEVGVDAESLCDFADFIFDMDDESDNGVTMVDGEVQITFERFMKVILDFRGSNHATVMHIMTMIKIMKTEFRSMTQRLHLGSKSQKRLDMPGKTLSMSSLTTSQFSTQEGLSEVGRPWTLPQRTGGTENPDEPSPPGRSFVLPPPRGATANLDAVVRTAKIEALATALRSELAQLSSVGSGDMCGLGENGIRHWASRFGAGVDRELQELQGLQQLEW